MTDELSQNNSTQSCKDREGLVIIPQDDDYQQTKRVKKSGAPLKSPFREVADWVAANYSVRVLNVIYDSVKPDDRPRLSVVLETEEDAQKFRDGANFSSIEQKKVREQFEAILLKQGDARFNLEGLFVIFVCFERVARVEANGKVTDKEVRSLKAKLANSELWEISRMFDGVTFFFYTDAQVKRYEAEGFRERYVREYSRLVEPYDEFGYLRKRAVSASFDSKENFDKNYQSNWFYYYR